MHWIRYSTYDKTGAEELPAWFSRLGNRPIVYITMGTVFNRLPGVMRTLVEGVEGLDVDAVVTTGRNVDPTSLGSLPPNVRAERYVPQAELLPHCDVVICHGGFNTVFGALASGRPVVAVPFSADQPLNAFLCDSNGLGVSCTTYVNEEEYFPRARPEELTAEMVTRSVTTVMTDTQFLTRAGALRDEIAAQPPVEHGVALLEKLVSTKAPIVRPD